MLDLALKMLLGDKAKYIMLISGLTFASLLMTEQAGIFCGIMQWTGSTLDNVGAPIWVVDPMVEHVNDTEAMRDTDVNRVRSVEGVAWAAPFYQGNLRTRMRDGSFKFVTLLGIDSTTFAGAPKEIIQGRLEDLRLPNTVILDEYGTKKLSRDPLHPIKVGDLIVLQARVTCTFGTSLEVQVDVFSEEALTGMRQRTSRAFLTFVAIDEHGGRVTVPPLLVETPDDERVCAEAHARREQRLKRRAEAR